MFLMTDAQVANEQFLVLINDMLASGEVADLFPDDEVENIIAGVRNEVFLYIVFQKRFSRLRKTAYDFMLTANSVLGSVKMPTSTKILQFH